MGPDTHFVFGLKATLREGGRWDDQGTVIHRSMDKDNPIKLSNPDYGAIFARHCIEKRCWLAGKNEWAQQIFCRSGSKKESWSLLPSNSAGTLSLTSTSTLNFDHEEPLMSGAISPLDQDMISMGRPSTSKSSLMTTHHETSGSSKRVAFDVSPLDTAGGASNLSKGANMRVTRAQYPPPPRDMSSERPLRHIPSLDGRIATSFAQLSLLEPRNSASHSTLNRSSTFYDSALSATDSFSAPESSQILLTSADISPRPSVNLTPRISTEFASRVSADVAPQTNSTRAPGSQLTQPYPADVEQIIDLWRTKCSLMESQADLHKAELMLHRIHTNDTQEEFQKHMQALEQSMADMKVDFDRRTKALQDEVLGIRNLLVTTGERFRAAGL